MFVVFFTAYKLLVKHIKIYLKENELMKKNKGSIVIISLLLMLMFLMSGCGIVPSVTKGTISGRVIAPPDGSELSKDISGWVPAASATITVVDTNGVTHTVTTDEDGYFVFTNIAVEPNTVISASVIVNGTSMCMKAVIPQAVAEDEDYDAGTINPHSTALGLIVEGLLEEGMNRGNIDLDQIESSSNFSSLVEYINQVMDKGNCACEIENSNFSNEIKDTVQSIIYPDEQPAPTPSSGSSSISIKSVSIYGNVVVGEELAATLSPSSGKATYQWHIADEIDGEYSDILDATSNTYTLQEDDFEKFIKVTATGTGKYKGTKASEAVGPIKKYLISVDIDGDSSFGETLTALLTPGSATTNFQWTICDTEDGSYNDLLDETGQTYTVVEEDIGKWIKVIAVGTDKYTGTVFSDSLGAISKADAQAPPAPTANNKTDNSITLNEINGAEYKIEDGNWQDSPEFTGLIPDTTYTFYARYKETNTHFASDLTGASITTEKGPVFTGITAEGDNQDITLNFDRSVDLAAGHSLASGDFQVAINRFSGSLETVSVTSVNQPDGNASSFTISVATTDKPLAGDTVTVTINGSGAAKIVDNNGYFLDTTILTRDYQIGIYYLTVLAETGGSAVDLTNSSPYAEGAVVSIEANATTGYEFLYWTTSNGTYDSNFENQNSASTTFTMPDSDVTITARFLISASNTITYTTPCNQWTAYQSGGGVGITIDVWDISSVATGSTIDFEFDAYGMPDRWFVYYNGQLVHETGWRGDSSYEGNSLYPGGIAGTGAGGVYPVITKLAGVDTLEIRSEGAQAGTAWQYRLRSNCL